VNTIRRIRTLLSELDQALGDLERELSEGPKRRPRKRPVVPVAHEASPPQETINRVRRACRRAGVAA